ncbi:MAG: hypothetical protein KC418_01785 [Anaerolineales bacterium]|nr:hypothetical protein [Anaerolineales bacterium]MCB8954569.1 hypothetical protein [Ardenticatenales bacterium]
MNDKTNGVFHTAVESQGQAFDLLQTVTTTARGSAVFSAPIEKGDYLVINAAEVSVGMGVGFGMGGGSGPMPAEGAATKEDAPGGYGSGGGGGGGGGAMSRPVAVIAIGPDGVRVEPIVDATKLGLAFFTMLGSFLLMLRGMRNAGKTK